MARMILICGASGCGKTTFARQLARSEGLLHFTPDDFYALINGDECIHENLFEAWSAMFLAIHTAERNGKDCIVDTNALTVGQRAEFLDWFPGFEHHLIYIEASEQLRQRNNRQRRRVIPEDAIVRMTRDIVPVTPEEDPRWKSISCWKNEDNHLTLLWSHEKGSAEP